MIARIIPALLFVLVACNDTRGADEPVVVSFAGELPVIADPSREPPDPGAALLLRTTARGLLALDGEGEVAPAIARRWIVLDDGLSYIFRLEHLEWADGRRVTADEIARQLEAALAPGSRNRLRGLLGEIESVSAVTPEILEITLRRPRRDFLQLLAQPDLAILRDSAGLGPLELAGAEGTRLMLRPRAPPTAAPDAGAPTPFTPDARRIAVNFEPMSRAVARFELGMSDLVLGGGWLDLVYAEAIEPAADQLVIDPVEGLFGLGIAPRSGFLGDGANRDALAMAIDRDAVVALSDRIDAEPRRTVMPAGAVGLQRLTLPAWAGAALLARRALAADLVARWRAGAGDIPALRVAMPATAGGTRLFAELRAGWRAIGIEAVRVAPGDDADITLIDRVAPTDSADWYLDQFRCGAGLVCSEALDDALAAARLAETARDRRDRLAEAEAALAALVPFIPLMRPIRWSLVSSRVEGFTANRHASHPLDALIDAR